MADLLGWSALLIAAAATLALALRHQGVALAMICAFMLRAAAAAYHVYIAPLPDGIVDAVAFEHYAWEWAQGGLGAAIGWYPGIDAYFYSWLMSLLYALTGRSPLMLGAVSVLVGVLAVYFTWRLARELWSDRDARKAAWVMSVFPLAVQYSALPMREAWVVLFFVVGLLGVVRWARGGGAMPAIGALMSFGIATFFHGGMFVALIAFLGVVGAQTARRWVAGLIRGRVRIFAGLGLCVVVGIFGVYISAAISVDKLGTVQEALSADTWMSYSESRTSGAAQYPQWTQPSSTNDLIWSTPLRTAYLLFSPFPWDIRTPQHLAGLVDGLFYLGFAILVWRNRRAIWRDPAARSVLIISLLLILAFAVGTGNFGTAVRHRAKLVAGLIVLAAPLLPRLIFRARTPSLEPDPA